MVTPIFERIADDIRAKIKDGRLQPGDKLPSRSALCAEWKCSANTVHNAMLVLRAEGLIEGHHGVGVYVANPTPST